MQDHIARHLRRDVRDYERTSNPAKYALILRLRTNIGAEKLRQIDAIIRRVYDPSTGKFSRKTIPSDIVKDGIPIPRMLGDVKKVAAIKAMMVEEVDMPLVYMVHDSDGVEIGARRWVSVNYIL